MPSNSLNMNLDYYSINYYWKQKLNFIYKYGLTIFVKTHLGIKTAIEGIYYNSVT